MPTDETILGFGNPWYEYGIRTAQTVEIEPDLSIRLLTSPTFLATKLSAYAGRGGGDLLGSHNIEDVIKVVAFRPAIVDEVRKEPAEPREWIVARIGEHLIDNPEAEDAVAANLPEARLVPEVISLTRMRLAALAALRAPRIDRTTERRPGR